MRIFICDDEEVFRRKIGAVIEGYFRGKADVEMVFGEDGEDVFRGAEEVDLLLLDIDMPGMDGISVKNLLQRRNVETKILFITNHEERMREAFGLQVMGFVDKGRLDEELPVLLKEIEESIFASQWIEGEDGKRYDSRKVCYIRSDGKNYVRLFFRNGENVFLRKTLKELELYLRDAEFLRVHREYLVNMREITKITGKEILIGEKSIPVSARKLGEARKAYKEYLRKHMRYQ